MAKTSKSNSTFSGAIGTAINNTVRLWCNDIMNAPIYEARIPLDLIKIDTRYQRGIKRAAISSFNEPLAGVLHCSYRASDPDVVYAMDGQHRITWAKAAGLDSLHCLIYCDLSIEDEAEIFRTQAQNTTKIAVQDAYRSALIAQDPTAIACQNILDKYHIKISVGNANSRLKAAKASHTLSAIQTAWAMCKRPNGPAKLDFILETIELSKWYVCPEAYSASFLGAYETVWNDIEAGADRNTIQDKLVTVLIGLNPQVVKGYAKTMYQQMDTRSSTKVIYRDISRGDITLKTILDEAHKYVI